MQIQKHFVDTTYMQSTHIRNVSIYLCTYVCGTGSSCYQDTDKHDRYPLGGHIKQVKINKQNQGNNNKIRENKITITKQSMHIISVNRKYGVKPFISTFPILFLPWLHPSLCQSQTSQHSFSTFASLVFRHFNHLSIHKPHPATSPFNHPSLSLKFPHISLISTSYSSLSISCNSSFLNSTPNISLMNIRHAKIHAKIHWM